MTVSECFKAKYYDWLKNMRANEWNNIKIKSEARKESIPYFMFMCLEITENDVRKEGYNSEFYQELKQLHENKLIASNKHRQEHDHINKYWLTKKGIKALSKELGLS